MRLGRPQSRTDGENKSCLSILQPEMCVRTICTMLALLFVSGQKGILKWLWRSKESTLTLRVVVWPRFSSASNRHKNLHLSQIDPQHKSNGTKKIWKIMSSLFSKSQTARRKWPLGGSDFVIMLWPNVKVGRHSGWRGFMRNSSS